jgi:hypothetical protein
MLKLVAIVVAGVSLFACSTAVQEEATESSGAALTGGYLGCYEDRPQRAFPVLISNDLGSVSQCRLLAAQAGYRYAALQYAHQCWAGNTIGYALAPESDCNMKCTLDGVCGGSWRNSVYTAEAPGTPPTASPGSVAVV